MPRFITIPTAVVPLLYSGLELEVWRLAEDLDHAFQSREENPHVWHEAPLDGLDRARELLCVIDWPQDHPPTEATVEIDTWREVLLGGLKAERIAQRDHRDDTENGPELRVEGARAVVVIEDFLASLPALEATASERGIDLPTAERGIVLEVCREDRPEQWSRDELARALHDVEPSMIDNAVTGLLSAGVIHQGEGEQVWKASQVTRRLHDLGLVNT